MHVEKLTFEMSVGASRNEHVYSLHGPLVLNNMFAFQEVLRSEALTTILDLTDVPFMDSAGLGVITNSYVARQKHGRKLLLVGANERVQALFKLTKLDQVFEVFPTMESAKLALAA